MVFHQARHAEVRDFPEHKTEMWAHGGGGLTGHLAPLICAIPPTRRPNISQKIPKPYS